VIGCTVVVVAGGVVVVAGSVVVVAGSVVVVVAGAVVVVAGAVVVAGSVVVVAGAVVVVAGAVVVAVTAEVKYINNFFHHIPWSNCMLSGKNVYLKNILKIKQTFVNTSMINLNVTSYCKINISFIEIVV